MWLPQALPLLFGAATALSSAEWRSQSIYQVVTDRFAQTDGSTTKSCGWGSYCGGTWQGIINKLDYIQDMGFTAVWISPVQQNIGSTPYGQPYHGYWTKNFNKLNTKFGTADDLKQLSAALHTRGMYLMVDVAVNHMAFNGAPSDVNYTTLTPFNSASYYHPYCPIDWSNKTSVQLCWAGDTVVSLADLRTEDEAVQTTFATWIKQFVTDYSIDGLRLDSAMSVSQSFWPTFVSAAGVYAVGEVLDGNPVAMCQWQDYMSGTLNYATYYWITRAFQSIKSTMSELANNIQWQNSTCKDVTLLGNFIENHDQPRFPSITNDSSLIINAMAFAILNDGIPIIYYGQEQGFSGSADPYNREPLWPSGYSTTTSEYTFIKSLNAARNLAIANDPKYVTTMSSVVASNSKIMVTSKGTAKGASLISVFTDYGSAGDGFITVPSRKTGISADTQFTDLLSCKTFAADTDGNLNITVSGGLPRVLYSTTALSGSDLCASPNTSNSTSATSRATSTSQEVSSQVSLVVSSTLDNATTTSSGIQAVSTVSSTTSSVTPKLTSSTVAISSSTQLSSSSSTAVPTSSASTKISATSYVVSQTIIRPTTTSKNTSTTASACAVASTVAVNFNLNVNTTWGTSIKVTGNITQLGDWAEINSPQLSAAGYSNSDPIWSTIVNIPAGVFFAYKFISVGSNGYVTWEGGANRNYAVPISCASTAVVNSTWRA